MCGINYFQLLNCLLYHITAYYTPGSLLSVAVTYTNIRETSQNIKKLYDITINIPSTNNQSPDILCMLSQMHIFIIYFAVCFLFILPLEILDSKASHVACRGCECTTALEAGHDGSTSFWAANQKLRHDSPVARWNQQREGSVFTGVFLFCFLVDLFNFEFILWGLILRWWFHKLVFLRFDSFR